MADSITNSSATTKNKIWKATSDSPAGFMITPDSAIMAGNADNFIAVSDLGTAIGGPVSFLTTSENIRQGGMFIQMNDFLQMIPKTIVTPIPSLIPFPPVAFFAGIAMVMPTVLALVV